MPTSKVTSFIMYHTSQWQFWNHRKSNYLRNLVTQLPFCVSSEGLHWSNWALFLLIYVFLFSVLVFFYVKYVDTERVNEVAVKKKILIILNRVAFFWGVLTALTLSLVSNFQINAIEKLHLVSGIVCLFSFVFYCILQVIRTSEVPLSSIIGQFTRI